MGQFLSIEPSPGVFESAFDRDALKFSISFHVLGSSGPDIQTCLFVIITIMQNYK